MKIRQRSKKVNPMEKCSVTISPELVEAIEDLIELYKAELPEKRHVTVTFSSVLRELIQLGVQSEYERLGLSNSPNNAVKKSK